MPRADDSAIVSRYIMSRDNASRTGGGAATQAGINYQNRVAAWRCVRILAEQDAASLWGLPEDVTFDFIRCETEQPVEVVLREIF